MAEDKICSILDLFCEIQTEICQKLEKRDEEDDDDSSNQDNNFGMGDFYND